MDLEFLKMFFQLIVALGITLGLMFLFYKVMGTKVADINNNKYVKVIERTQVTKENSILIVKAGKKGYLMTSTTGHMEKIAELSEEEIEEIEEKKQRSNEEIIEKYNDVLSSSRRGIIKVVKKFISKEEKDEK